MDIDFVSGDIQPPFPHIRSMTHIYFAESITTRRSVN